MFCGSDSKHKPMLCDQFDHGIQERSIYLPRWLVHQFRIHPLLTATPWKILVAWCILLNNHCNYPFCLSGHYLWYRWLAMMAITISISAPITPAITPTMLSPSLTTGNSSAKYVATKLHYCLSFFPFLHLKKNVVLKSKNKCFLKKLNVVYTDFSLIQLFSYFAVVVVRFVCRLTTF